MAMLSADRGSTMLSADGGGTMLSADLTLAFTGTDAITAIRGIGKSQHPHNHICILTLVASQVEPRQDGGRDNDAPIARSSKDSSSLIPATG